MRYLLCAALVTVSVSIGGAAFAQNQQPSYVPTQQYNSNAQIYLSPQGVPMYAPDNGAIPNYNNSARPLALNQMIAGQNAPSYNYNNNAYTDFGSGTNMNVGSYMTPQQANVLRARQDAEAASRRNQYLADMSRMTRDQQQQSNAGNSSAYQGAAFNHLYNSSDRAQVPTKRRVIYNERNNPLQDPPRLFNPN